MSSLSDLRREGASGRSQSRIMTEEERAQRILVYEYTGNHETDYLIDQACKAPKGRRLKAAFEAVESLARIAAEVDEDYLAATEPVIETVLKRSGYAVKYLEEAQARRRIWDRFLSTYRLHKAPQFAGAMRHYCDSIKAAAAKDRRVGCSGFDEAWRAFEDAIIEVGDQFDPYLSVASLAAELNGALDSDIPWRLNKTVRLEAEKTIGANFYGRRVTRDDKLEAIRHQFRQRRHYSVDPPAPKPKDRFEITLLDEIEENPVKEWLIDDMVGEGEFSCFWGMPGCGKSVIVGDAAFHVAAGLPWFNKPVSPGLVVYIAAERAELTKRRLAALRKKHSLKNVPLAVVKGRLDLTSGLDDAKAIVQAVRDTERAAGKDCVWVIIDTVARSFGAGDENAAKDMGAYVQACDLIRQEIGKAHLSLVHHCSRTGEKPRGSIALDGAVDVTFKVSKSGELHSVVVDKENDTPDAGVLRFKLTPVDLGRDRKGKQTTAPLVEPDNSTVVAFETADGGKVSLSRNKPRKAALVLAKALEEAGQLSPDGRTGVHEAELRKRIRDASNSGSVKESSLDTIVRRNLKDLIDKGDAEKIGEWFFPKQAEGSKDNQVGD